MFGGGAAPSATRWKDGREWRLGSDTDVAWIREGTPPGLSITSAIPPIFESYATVLVSNKDEARAEDLDVLLRLLDEQTPDQLWWLGYLETGADDVVFADAPRVTLYAGWRYVLVQATPAEAGRWRDDLESWRAPGPDLIFPADHSWLVSGSGTTTGDAWGDRPHSSTGCWTSRGRRRGASAPDEDATPPGHVAR